MVDNWPRPSRFHANKQPFLSWKLIYPTITFFANLYENNMSQVLMGIDINFGRHPWVFAFDKLAIS